MIVVDASVLVDFLLGRAQAVDAVRRALTDREHEPLHAPDLIEPETLDVLRRLARRGTVDERRATEAVADLQDLRMIRYPHAALRGRVWALRHELTAYDACYVALAEALEATAVLTGDAGLAARARASLGDPRVRLVS